MLTYLPVEIVVIVIKGLDLRDIGNLTSVCKYLREIANPRQYTCQKDFERRKRCAKLRRNNLFLPYIVPIDLFNMPPDSPVARGVMACPYITFDIIISKADHRWYWPGLSSNPNITVAQFVEICEIKANAIRIYEEINRIGAVKFVLSRHAIITFDDLYELDYIVDNKASIGAITLELWNQYKSSELSNISFDDLTARGNITERDIVENPHLNWRYDHLLENPNISTAFLWKRRRIDETVTMREVARYCADVKTRDNFEYMCIYKQLDGHNKFGPEIMQLCSKLFNIDLILRFRYLQWNWPIIQGRRDIPMTYRLANRHLVPNLIPKYLSRESIEAELDYERGLITDSTRSETLDHRKKIMESPIYSWQSVRELGLTHNYYRDDAPPYLWAYDPPIDKILESININDI